MERAIHKKGYIQGLPDIVLKLANADDANLRNYLKVLVEQHGVIFSDYPTSNELKVYLTGGGWSVRPGSAVDVNRDLIIVPETFNDIYDFPSGVGSRKHAIVVRYKQYYNPAEDVPYDKSYSDNGHTYAHNSFEIVALGPGETPAVTDVYLADLVYNMDTALWLVVDKRNKNVMVLRRWIDAETPPIPTRLRLTTGYDEQFGQSQIVLNTPSRPAWIKAEFGDWGTGTALGNQFTWSTNQLGDWIVDEWVGQYLIDNVGNKWLVVDNDAKTLTLETGATPVSGNFMLGPGAKGYRFVLITYGPPPTELEEGISEDEMQYMESPVPMQYIWHGLMANIKYGVRVASQNTWFPDEWSPYCETKTIIAGGPKKIPDNCADAVSITSVSAEDDGIKVNLVVNPVYSNEIAGFEVVWTDDGSEPDFGSSAHRRKYTERTEILLPSRLSTKTTDVIVKAKIRIIDKSGRHCLIPIAITPTVAKKYIGDLKDIVDEIIEARGEAPSLVERLNVALEPSGRVKVITEIEGEVAQARGGYPTLSEHIEAILAGKVDWAYTRVVAKSGGHYPTIREAIASITPVSSVDKITTILVCGGEYDNEDIDCIANADYRGKNFLIVGLYRPRIIGRIKCEGHLHFRGIVGVRMRAKSGLTEPMIDIDNGGGCLIQNCWLYSDVVGQPVVQSVNTELISTTKGVIISESTIISGSNSNALFISWTDNAVLNSLLAGGNAPAVWCAGKIKLQCFNNDLTCGTATYDIDGANTDNTIWLGHNRYSKGVNSANLDIRPGTLDQVSNLIMGSDWLKDLIRYNEW